MENSEAFYTPSILHVDTGMGWRGGQQQAFYLSRELTNRGVFTGMACRPDSLLERACRRSGVPVYPISMRGEWDLAAGIRLARVSRELGYLLLHAHCAHGVMLGLWARAFNPGLTLLATRRVDFSIGRSPLGRFKYANPWLVKIICISAAIRTVLMNDGIPEPKMVIVPSGVDIHRFVDADPERAHHIGAIPEDGIIVGTVAALVGHKDYPTLMRAAARVLSIRDDVFFCALGDGEEQAPIHALARKLKLGRRFIFAGFQENVGDYLKRFDLFVLASQMEGLGSSILDAMALGLPIVATKTGGIPEMLSHGETALMVPPRDPHQLSQAILKLVGSRALRRQLGQNARHAVKRFSLDNMVEGNLRVYFNLLKKKLKTEGRGGNA
jgi:glycosyltransferase involved in cell wall biosynthesis